MRRDETELARGGVVAAAGDDHVSEAADRREAAVPVDERQEGVARTSGAVRLERAGVRGGTVVAESAGRPLA